MIKEDGLSIQVDTAFIRLNKTEQNLHQGGFAGPVFSYQRMDLSFQNFNRDPPICPEFPVFFGDALHKNQRRKIQIKSFGPG